MPAYSIWRHSSIDHLVPIFSWEIITAPQYRETIAGSFEASVDVIVVLRTTYEVRISRLANELQSADSNSAVVYHYSMGQFTFLEQKFGEPTVRMGNLKLELLSLLIQTS